MQCSCFLFFVDQNLWSIENIFTKKKWSSTFFSAVRGCLKDTPFEDNIQSTEEAPLWLKLTMLTKSNIKFLNYFLQSLVRLARSKHFLHQKLYLLGTNPKTADHPQENFQSKIPNTNDAVAPLLIIHYHEGLWNRIYC